MNIKKCDGCDYYGLNCDGALCAMCDHEPELIIECISEYDYSVVESVDESVPFLVL